MNCYQHSDREAVGVCVSCGKGVCGECKVELGGKFYCRQCADKAFTGNVQAANAAGANTSGSGSAAVIPPEIRGWNWGAFLLTWIWGIGNNVWIALLGLVPAVWLVMAIILGIKGNEWAWQNKKWDSVSHFQRTQRTWAWWGLGVLVASVVISFFFFALVGIAGTTIGSVSSFR